MSVYLRNDIIKFIHRIHVCAGLSYPGWIYANNKIGPRRIATATRRHGRVSWTRDKGLERRRSQGQNGPKCLSGLSSLKNERRIRRVGLQKGIPSLVGRLIDYENTTW